MYQPLTSSLTLVGIALGIFALALQIYEWRKVNQAADRLSGLRRQVSGLGISIDELKQQLAASPLPVGNPIDDAALLMIEASIDADIANRRNLEEEEADLELESAARRRYVVVGFILMAVALLMQGAAEIG